MALGIEVDEELTALWRQWLAPEVQPFWVDSLEPWPRTHRRAGKAIGELDDTFATWRFDRSLETLWLDEKTFFDMPRARRAALVRAQADHRRGAVPSAQRWSDLVDRDQLRLQADGRRFVWWPTLVAANAEILKRVVSRSPTGAAPASLPSRHAEVSPATWDACGAALPDARRLAGSFPASAGPNCFSTVLAAAGISWATTETVLREPFVDWLASACTPGGRDTDAGTVLVWRECGGMPFHAAVTIGDGWALEKASGEWWTPRAVRPVNDVIRTSRARGLHLERHRILAAH